MKRLLIFACPVLVFFSCAKESSNPVNSPGQPLKTIVLFGQEKSTPADEAVHFVPLPYQNTTNFQYLDLTQYTEFSIQVSEHGVPFDGQTFDQSKFVPSDIVFHLNTKYDQEGFEGNVNCRVGFAGWSWSQSDQYITFEARIPVAIDSQIGQNNGRLEFTGSEDDFVILRYVSPFTGLTVVDTVTITKNI